MHGLARERAAPDVEADRRDGRRRPKVGDRDAFVREIMAVFDELPPALREAINYAPEPLDPERLAALCRRHGAGNVLAMVELKLKRSADSRRLWTAPQPADPRRSGARTARRRS
jgi:hypothetical protein